MLLTAAARSIWPAGAALGFAAPPGLGAVGGGGLPPPGLGAGGFGDTPGFAASGGGFGLFAMGGGPLAPMELPGLELTGVVSVELPVDPPSGFFHGAANPLEGAIPGKTATGLADAFAAMDVLDALTIGTAAGLGAVGAGAGAGAGMGRRPGGGGGAAGAFGLGGTNSR